MASAEELRAAEAAVPWEREDFRTGLGLLTSSSAAAAKQLAADARVLGLLAGMVPRCRGDETGGTPWTSFRRQVAVARSVSDQAAAVEIRRAQRLTTVLPHTMDLLEAGRITAGRAIVLIDELEAFDDELAGQLDADLADVAARLAPWRIKQEVRRAALAIDAEAAALRNATATAERGTFFRAEQDGQASLTVFGPAVPVTRWHTSIDRRARALKAAGDPRTLDQLRFDLTVQTLPCDVHAPADPTAPDAPTSAAPGGPGSPGAPAGPAGPASPAASVGSGVELVLPSAADRVTGDPDAGLRPTGVEPASADCRMSRPVQASIVVPVETSLGLSNEPGWLDGYGWIDAPTARLLLIDAELRRVCAQTGTGQLVDVAARDVRPPPTPAGVREALLEMVNGPVIANPVGWQVEDQHDPSRPLREFVVLRDRGCDGPTFTSTPASRCELDHDIAYPDGPTAAWNLVARATRTHQLKHAGWTPLRTPTSTIWTSPAGQLIEVPKHTAPPPGIDVDPAGHPATLPDPDQLAALDTAQLTPPGPDDRPPWVPHDQRPEPTEWTWLTGSATGTGAVSDPAPF
jgi:hypothetical protein